MVAALGLAGVSTAFSLLKMLQSRSDDKKSKGSTETQEAGQAGQNLPGGVTGPASFDPAALFAALDANKSGGVSKEELIDGLKKGGTGSAAGKSLFDSRTLGALLSVQEQSQASGKADKLFSRLDTDKNGAISMDEFAGALKGGKQVDASKNGLDTLFNAMDKNHDGSISAAELKAAMEGAANRGHHRHHHQDGNAPAVTPAAVTAAAGSAGTQASA